MPLPKPKTYTEQMTPWSFCSADLIFRSHPEHFALNCVSLQWNNKNVCFFCKRQKQWFYTNDFLSVFNLYKTYLVCIGVVMFAMSPLASSLFGSLLICWSLKTIGLQVLQVLHSYVNPSYSGESVMINSAIILPQDPCAKSDVFGPTASIFSCKNCLRSLFGWLLLFWL